MSLCTLSSEREEINLQSVCSATHKRRHAYYAFDSESELEVIRKKLEADKSAFSYNSTTRMELKNSLYSFTRRNKTEN